MNRDWIDLLAEFNAQAVDHRVVVHLDGMTVPVISRHHLIANKKASGRLQDLADVERLEEVD